jgi:hypothetical protein
VWHSLIDSSGRQENPMRLIALLLLFASSVTDYSGTWVANIEKSQLGAPPPKSYVLKVEKTGPVAFLVTIDQVLADGKERHQQFTRTYDGEEHAISDAPKGATETCTQVDPLTRHIVGENNGKITYEINSKMAPDQKTMTTRQTFLTPDGKVREVRVFVFERR